VALEGVPMNSVAYQRLGNINRTGCIRLDAWGFRDSGDILIM
jgi:hypothetical protein